MKKQIINKIIAAIAMCSIGFISNTTYAAQDEAQKSYTVKGEVIAVDKTAGKVKLKHNAILELEWPAMTMFFTMTNKSQLDALNIGDQVDFRFVKVNGGAPLITQIRVVR